jgi:hypothetical protein
VESFSFSQQNFFNKLCEDSDKDLFTKLYTTFLRHPLRKAGHCSFGAPLFFLSGEKTSVVRTHERRYFLLKDN